MKPVAASVTGRSLTDLADTLDREALGLLRAAGPVFLVVVIVLVVDVSVAVVMRKFTFVPVVAVVMLVLAGVTVIAMVMLVLAGVTVIAVVMVMLGIMTVVAMVVVVMGLGVRLAVAVGQGGERADGGQTEGKGDGRRGRAQKYLGFHGAKLRENVCVLGVCLE